MNIEIEKKKYVAPSMEVVEMGYKTGLLDSSEVSIFDEEVDNNGFDGEFN
ncbi:MAG: hypothetical protein IIT53_00065 [Fibrobacter sp.]|nr:hypothetical protein [Fibrobacter sp.]